MDTILFIVIIFVPVALAYFLRSNGALAFLALCGGFTAMTLSGSDIQQIVDKTRITSLSSSNVDLGLLIIPLLLTLLLTPKSAPTKSLWKALHIACAVLAGGLLAIVAAPMFGNILNIDYSSSTIWKDLVRAQSYIIGIGLLLSLLLIWLNSPKGASKKHK